MTREQEKRYLEMVEHSRTALVTAVDGEGFPHTLAMLTVRHEGLMTHYFSTNLSAEHTALFQKNPRACVYFFDHGQWLGLRLKGEMTVHTDHEHRAQIWREGDEQYYPQGVDDPDYCVLEFRAQGGGWYDGTAGDEYKGVF